VANHKTILQMRSVFNPMTLLTVALSVAILFSGITAISVSAAAPAEGIVVEGVSVPSVALGDTRAMVEATYGPPYYCSGSELSLCQFYVEGGGTVLILYHGPDGGYATGSPDDFVYYIRWYQAVSGWVTTAGINTTLAFNDMNAVLAAYPNATISYPSLLDMSIDDPALGIHIDYHTSYPDGTQSVWMAISFPDPNAPPPEAYSVRVTAIDLFADKHNVYARVHLQDNRYRYTSGASVAATWTLPDGSQVSVNGTTNSMGYAYFEFDKARRGTYTFTVDNVVFEDFRFDTDNSILSASIDFNVGKNN
jgi:hypothetical protein